MNAKYKGFVIYKDKYGIIRSFLPKESKKSKEQRRKRIADVDGVQCYEDPRMETKSIKNDFIKHSNPGKGTVTKDEGISKGTIEYATALWLHKNFGGNIKVLKAKNRNHSNPDYLWKGKWWELKSPGSLNGISSRLDAGINQIGDKLKETRGGIILNIQDVNLDNKKIIEVVKGRLGRSANFETKVLIKKGDKLIDILEYKYK